MIYELEEDEIAEVEEDWDDPSGVRRESKTATNSK